MGAKATDIDREARRARAVALRDRLKLKSVEVVRAVYRITEGPDREDRRTDYDRASEWFGVGVKARGRGPSDACLVWLEMASINADLAERLDAAEAEEEGEAA